MHHIVSKHLPRRDLAEAISLEQDAVRHHPEQIVLALNGTGIDHMGALAVSACFGSEAGVGYPVDRGPSATVSEAIGG